MPLNIPILLTWLRIVAIPLLLAAYCLPEDWVSLTQANFIATVIFVAAAITDWADGYLARKLNQTSAFGAFLDPVADKLMVAAALILLVELERTSALIAFIIIGREITISALREWMAKIGAAKSVAVSMLGKIKTTAQMTAIPMLLFHDPLFAGTALEVDVAGLGNPLLSLAALLTVWSMVYYLMKAWPEIQAAERSQNQSSRSPDQP